MTSLSSMKMCAPLIVALLLVAAGCGTSKPQQNKDFFTSGNREADQRADQRMARTQQLKGEGGASAQKASGDVNAKLTLYERLGGDNGIKAIVEDFTSRAMADPRANWERKGVKRGGFNLHSNHSMTWNPNAQNVQTLKTHMTEFLSLATGGPARYDGKEIRQAHQGMHITNAEFDAVVGDLKATLDKLKVGDKEQKELISVVESTRQEIAEQR